MTLLDFSVLELGTFLVIWLLILISSEFTFHFFYAGLSELLANFSVVDSGLIIRFRPNNLLGAGAQLQNEHVVRHLVSQIFPPGYHPVYRHAVSRIASPLLRPRYPMVFTPCILIMVIFCQPLDDISEGIPSFVLICHDHFSFTVAITRISRVKAQLGVQWPDFFTFLNRWPSLFIISRQFPCIWFYILCETGPILSMTTVRTLWNINGLVYASCPRY